MILPIMLYLLLNKQLENNTIATLINNCLIGVFASSFVVIISSIRSYFIAKKNAIMRYSWELDKYILFLPKFIEALLSEQDGKTSNLNTLVHKVKFDKQLYEMVEKMNEIYENCLYAYDFSPFFKHCNKNSLVIEMTVRFAEFNTVFQVFDIAYQKENYKALKIEKEELDKKYPDALIENQLFILLQKDNVDKDKTQYAGFKEAREKLRNIFPYKTTSNTKWAIKILKKGEKQ
jgi:hypothetical protein